MTENEVREIFSKRVAAQKQIDTRQQEIEKMINKWQENFLLDRGYLRFGRDMDITVRLSILHNLTERFRNEFVKNGDIPGRHKYNSGLYSVDELIIEMITKYLEVFPIHGSFTIGLRKTDSMVSKGTSLAADMRGDS